MRFSPVLVVHILAGIAGLLSGAAAMSFRKGSERHRLMGNVFVVAMMTLGTTAAYLAYVTGDFGNLVGGVFTVYLVGTAWLTARRPDGRTGILHWVGMVAAFAGSAKLFYDGARVWQLPHHSFKGVPAAMIFFLGTVALLCAVGDLRMIFRRLSETSRLSRHLWRMCYALFVASGSFFLGRIRIFPIWARDAYIPFVLAVLPLLLMVFWLMRVRMTNVRITSRP